ncbi:MAG: hypothetical protein WAV23_03705 [Minisyncoccia bacterium]
MKHKQYFKKSIISFLLVGAILVPYFGTAQNAYAQFNYGSGNTTSGQQGVSYYMKMAGPMIPKLQGCKDVMKNGIAKGVNAIKGLFNKGENKVTDKLQDKLGLATTIVQSVPTDSETANNKLGDINSTTKGVKSTADLTASNKLCLDSVGKMIAKMLIKTLTDSTIKWINTGNFGESFWPKDRQTFFQDFAKNEILKFNSEINNATLYPFGRAFMQNQALSLKSHFAQNAQYSLNKVIQDTTPEYTSLSFTTDFSAGGWNAWSALTQVPANNPIGFNLQASNELQARLEGTVQTAAQNVRDTLKEAGGFLGQEQCASNHAITRQTEKQALIEGNPHLVPGTSDYDNWNNDNVCQKWEYVTPGGMIAQAATKLMDDEKDQLLSVTDLNDAIAAILDAAISKWGGELMDQGLASLSPVSANEQFDLTDPTGNNGQTQVEQDFPPGSNTTWLSENPDFNIQTDITQALIDTQRTYVSKIENYNKELEALIRTIYQLDYCMPGPHPEWEEDSSANLEIIGNTILSDIQPPLSDVATIAGKILDPSGIIFGYLSDKKEKKEISAYIAQLLKTMIGANGFGDTETNDKLTRESAVTFLNGMYDAYKKTIDKYYTDPNKMPITWKESVQKFNQVPGYQQIIENNKSEIIFQNANITKLKTLKEAIDNGSLTDFSPTSYVIKQFARISQYLVSGNDIANMNSLYEQTQGERNYVWGDLLKGPDGCERDLRNNWGTIIGPNGWNLWQLYALNRMHYPYPILYDYNVWNEGEILPNTPISYNTGWPLNKTITPIPGVEFSAISPYTNLPWNNQQAFTHGAATFLGMFRVQDAAMVEPNITDAAYCSDLGIDCGEGHYMLTNYYEQNVLSIY